MSNNVKVAVRIRPLSKNEVRQGAAAIVTTSPPGSARVVINLPATPAAASPGVGQRSFQFDHAFESTLGVSPDASEDRSQVAVFEVIGTDVVTNAWAGYNCSLFAYGQTGAGKSYSMIGTHASPGLIPRIASSILDTIKQHVGEGLTCRVEVSFIEIYNERVKDLLNPRHDDTLRVREHPASGPYVENLSKMVVTSNAELMPLLQRGFNTRTTAATNVNEASSRSHAIFTMVLTQTRFDVETNTLSDKVSRINLVDLAGSERVAISGAQGQQLKEAGTINKSLFYLSRVITELSEGSRHVSYRESVLTWLLRESLGGNAKTIMLANISPADLNFDETISTLRYAVRASSIVNEAVVNEDPAVVLINDLRAEVARLKQELSKNGLQVPHMEHSPAARVVSPMRLMREGDPVVLSPPRPGEAEDMQAWTASIQHHYENSRALVQSMLDSRTQQKQRADRIRDLIKNVDERIEDCNTLRLHRRHPYFLNVTPSMPLGACMAFYAPPGSISVGAGLSDESPREARVEGLGIARAHASVTNVDGSVTVRPFDGAVCLVNERPIQRDTPMREGDTLRLGETVTFIFHAAPPVGSGSHASTRQPLLVRQPSPVRQSSPVRQPRTPTPTTRNANGPNSLPNGTRDGALLGANGGRDSPAAAARKEQAARKRRGRIGEESDPPVESIDALGPDSGEDVLTPLGGTRGPSQRTRRGDGAKSGKPGTPTRTPRGGLRDLNNTSMIDDDDDDGSTRTSPFRSHNALPPLNVTPPQSAGGKGSGGPGGASPARVRPPVEVAERRSPKKDVSSRSGTDVSSRNATPQRTQTQNQAQARGPTPQRARTPVNAASEVSSLGQRSDGPGRRSTDSSPLRRGDGKADARRSDGGRPRAGSPDSANAPTTPPTSARSTTKKAGPSRPAWGSGALKGPKNAMQAAANKTGGSRARPESADAKNKPPTLSSPRTKAPPVPRRPTSSRKSTDGRGPSEDGASMRDGVSGVTSPPPRDGAKGGTSAAGSTEADVLSDDSTVRKPRLRRSSSASTVFSTASTAAKGNIKVLFEDTGQKKGYFLPEGATTSDLCALARRGRRETTPFYIFIVGPDDVERVVPPEARPLDVLRAWHDAGVDGQYSFQYKQKGRCTVALPDGSTRVLQLAPNDTTANLAQMVKPFLPEDESGETMVKILLDFHGNLRNADYHEKPLRLLALDFFSESGTSNVSWDAPVRTRFVVRLTRRSPHKRSPSQLSDLSIVSITSVTSPTKSANTSSLTATRAPAGAGGSSTGSLHSPRRVVPPVPTAAHRVTQVEAREQLLGAKPVLGAVVQETGGDGVIISEIRPALAAAAAGLLPDDVILSVGGRPTNNQGDFNETMRTAFPGEIATFTLERDGSRMDVPVMFGASGIPMDKLDALRHVAGVAWCRQQAQEKS